jgi:phage terminase large subunit-like protein|tara:strand:+ start:1384 stop:2640 length:1257 start_codon:yes stop_codon:yes gene_type:complete
MEHVIPDVFAPLFKPARYKGGYGGRGSGKSHTFATMAIAQMSANPGSRGVCIREVQKSLKESAHLLLADSIKKLGLDRKFEVQSSQIRTPGGGLISFQGMQDHTADSIKSLEGYNWAWVEEAQTMSQRSLELLRPTIREPGSELWFSWNPRNATDPVDKLFRGLIEPDDDSIIVRSNYMDNQFFPLELEKERLFDRKHNPDRYGHIWLGDYEPMAIGAIWDRAMLHEGRRDEAPDMDRIVVAVDPAVSSEEHSDEHGIVVAGIGEDQRGYVLDDVSIKGGPKQWATRAIAAYDRYDADAIVIEINQGGDMVRHTLESIRKNIRIIEVRATRGKHVRAEPISALYALGRVSHVGTFETLETQMCQMTAGGFEGPGSPDHVDALVWAFTELMPGLTIKNDWDDWDDDWEDSQGQSAIGGY